MEEQSKKWSARYMTGDRVVFNGPGWVKKITVCPKANKQTSTDFHDGIDTSGAIKFRAQTMTGKMEDVDFPCSLKFNKGLFINCDGDIYSVFVQYREEK